MRRRACRAESRRSVGTVAEQLVADARPVARRARRLDQILLPPATRRARVQQCAQLLVSAREIVPEAIHVWQEVLPSSHSPSDATVKTGIAFPSTNDTET